MERIVMPFYSAFQVTRMVVFEICVRPNVRTEQDKNGIWKYRRNGYYLSIVAGEFNHQKTDFIMCGQCMEEVLPHNSLAYKFFRKWYRLHCHKVNANQFRRIMKDLLCLMTEYNHILNKNKEISFSKIKVLSMERVKTKKQ